LRARKDDHVTLQGAVHERKTRRPRIPVHLTDRLKLVNDVTGQPMPDHPYVIQRADGRLEHGMSDPNGFTHQVSSHLPETIKLFLEE
jgi:uncharacterized protein (DUF2345 family)